MPKFKKVPKSRTLNISTNMRRCNLSYQSVKLRQRENLRLKLKTLTFAKSLYLPSFLLTMIELNNVQMNVSGMGIVKLIINAKLYHTTLLGSQETLIFESNEEIFSISLELSSKSNTSQFCSSLEILVDFGIVMISLCRDHLMAT